MRRRIRPICAGRTGIILRSGALRTLHDLALCASLGANAVAPYAIYAVSLKKAPRPARKPLSDEDTLRALDSSVKILTAGLQKVTSTIGCHELRGYGPFLQLGRPDGQRGRTLRDAQLFGSAERGLTWDAIQADAEARASDLRGDTRARLANADRFYPKMWKKAESVAHGELSLEEYTDVPAESPRIKSPLPFGTRWASRRVTSRSPPTTSTPRWPAKAAVTPCRCSSPPCHLVLRENWPTRPMPKPPSGWTSSASMARVASCRS